MRFASLRMVSAAMLAASAYATWGQSVPPAAGGDLLRSCTALVALATKGGDISVDATSCAAYLKGLRDGIDASARPVAERAFCAPSASLDEMAGAIVKHFQDNPENTRRHASGEAIAALGRAYPCVKK